MRRLQPLHVALWLERTPTWLMLLLGALVMLFLAIEFFIAATLYRPSDADRASAEAKLLSIASYGLSGLCALGMSLVLLVGLLASLAERR